MKYTYLLSLIFVVACTKPVPGPDKQFVGSAKGAALGAGAGAIVGAELSAATGPGVAIGAGLGALAGGIQGYLKDQEEENYLALAAATHHEREVAYAHEVLEEHYRRRIELHPTRDIYPADLFFYGDEVTLKPSARQLVRELVKLNKTRYPHSRLAIAAYVKAADEESDFAHHLAMQRSKELGDYFVREGLEPRRIETRAIIVAAPVLIDPNDSKNRYSQAIELIPVDR